MADRGLDAPHGTYARYKAGCHETCCRRARKRYNVDHQRDLAAGRPRQLDCEPVRRKVHALAALGWTAREVAERMEPPISQQAISQILARDTIRSSTAARIDKVYARLEMLIPPASPYHKRRKTEALAKGWLPPMAYDDIDAGVVAAPIVAAVDDLSPAYSRSRFSEFEIDHALQYHDFSRRLSPLEKAEIVRRWTRAGKTERSLCELTGWREGRYR